MSYSVVHTKQHLNYGSQLTTLYFMHINVCSRHTNTKDTHTRRAEYNYLHGKYISGGWLWSCEHPARSVRVCPRMRAAKVYFPSICVCTKLHCVAWHRVGALHSGREAPQQWNVTTSYFLAWFPRIQIFVHCCTLQWTVNRATRFSAQQQ